MKTTTGLSIAALVAALVATPALALGPHVDVSGSNDDVASPDHFTFSHHGIDAESVIAIDVSADGSVDVYEG